MSDAHGRLYVGCPLAGKTLLASIHFVELIRARGVPGIVVDSEGATNFASMPHAASVEDLIERVWTRGETCAIIPEDSSDVDRVAEACRFPGDVVFFLDECAPWISRGRGTGGPLLRLLRTCRHRGTDILLTTQHLSGDIPSEVFACAPEVYVFRTTSWPALERLAQQYRLDPIQLQALPPLQYLRVLSGFFS
jgi:hypothetical protein